MGILPMYQLNCCVQQARTKFLPCFQIIYLNKTPEEAYRCLLGPSAPPFISFRYGRDHWILFQIEAMNCLLICEFINFRDASFGVASFYITLLDVFHGLYKAYQKKFFDFSDFDPDEYEYYEVCFIFFQ